MEETLNEDLLEKLYWDFNSERNKCSLSERDIFKHKVRMFVKYTLSKKPQICSFCGLERSLEGYCVCGNEEVSPDMIKKFKELYN
jgi:hypothetical protein